MKAFTLPNGSGVLLHELSQSDWDALRKWAQKTYIADVSSAVDGMSEQLQYSLIREAVDLVTNSSFDMGLCLEILFGSPVGLARVHYQMIHSPGLSFNDFFNQVFPHSLYLRTGLEVYAKGFVVLNGMCEAVYGAPIDKVFWNNDTLVQEEEEKDDTPAESAQGPEESPVAEEAGDSAVNEETPSETPVELETVDVPEVEGVNDETSS